MLVNNEQKMFDFDVIQQNADKTTKKVILTVEAQGVSWTYKSGAMSETCSLAYKQILKSEHSVKDEVDSLSILYVKVIVGEVRSVTLRHDTVWFHASADTCSEIHRHVQKLLQETQKHRPKRLLVFINPIAGNQNSVSLYSQIVEPLFVKAGVDATAIVTEHEDHAQEFLATYDLTKADGVISMGGDGSYCQIFRGLMNRTMKDAKVDMNNVSAQLVKPKIPLGFLPSGSGCAFCHATFASIDLETAVLSIIIGKKQEADTIVLRYCDGTFLNYSILGGMQGGYICAFMLTERLRFLKKARYWLLMPIAWWAFKHYRAEIEYIPVPKDQKTFTYASDPDPTFNNPNFIQKRGTKNGYQTITCDVSGIYMGVESFTKALSWKTVRPYKKPNMCEGKMRLNIEKLHSFWQMLVWNMKLHRNIPAGDQPRRHIPRELNEQIEVTEAIIRMPTEGDLGIYGACYDGIPAYTTEYHAKVHPKKCDMFVIDDDIVAPILQYAE